MNADNSFLIIIIIYLKVNVKAINLIWIRTFNVWVPFTPELIRFAEDINLIE